MMAPVHDRAEDARTLLARMAMAAGFLGLLITSYVTAWTGQGNILIVGIIGLFGVVLVVRRPTIGVFILMTTFLFTYPAFLRGVGNLTINNVLGLLLVPLMLYEILRDRGWWVVRFRPFLLVALIVACLLLSARYYGGASEYVQQIEETKTEVSQRAQGPALIETRDAAAKLVTRFVFLVLFVFFVRTRRDMQAVTGVVIAALLVTYFSLSLGQGAAGWGTGRLRALGEAGESVAAARNPNKMAFFALWGLMLVWYARRAIRRPIWYPLWAAITALTFVMIPLTGSRSGMLNLLLFTLIVLLEGKFGYRKIVGVAAITFVVVVQVAYQQNIIDLLLPEQTAARLEKLSVNTDVTSEEGLEATGSASGRLRTIEAAVRVWKLHPLFGVGMGNFESERARTDPYGTIGPPHNSILWALAEGGIVVFSLYLLLFAWTYWQLNRLCWEYEARYGPMQLGWLVSAQRTVLVCFGFFSIFADMWYHDFFWIIMGTNFALIHLHEQYSNTGVVPTRFMLTGGPVSLVGPSPAPSGRTVIKLPATSLRP